MGEFSIFHWVIHWVIVLFYVLIFGIPYFLVCRWLWRKGSKQQ